MESPTPDKKVTRFKDRTFWISILISLVALTLAGLHLFAPYIEIDAITLGLLLIAFLPWLSPILKSIELPGGIKVELREEIRQLDNKLTAQLQEEEIKRQEIAERVERVEETIFKGVPVQPDIQDKTVAALTVFDDYLRSIGAVYGEFPQINVRDDLPPNYQAHYDPEVNELVVSQRWIDDIDVIRREFCYRAFHQPLIHDTLGQQLSQTVVTGAARGAGGIVSGFGFYFPCSYKQAAPFGRHNMLDLSSKHLIYGNVLGGTPTVGQSVMEIIALGERWAHAFWEIRQTQDARTFDRHLVAAWEAVPKSVETVTFDRIFTDNLANFVAKEGTSSTKDSVRQIIRGWNLIA